MLCTSSCLGDAVPSDSVGHISYPSISRLLTSPPARPYSVGSQSDKCIRSMLTRPLDANRGLWMKDVPRMPPVGIDAGYNFEHCLHSKEPSSWEEDDVIIYRETSTYCTSTSLQPPLSSVPRVAIVERFNPITLTQLTFPQRILGSS